MHGLMEGLDDESRVYLYSKNGVSLAYLRFV